MIQVKGFCLFFFILVFSSIIISCGSKEPSVLKVDNQQEKEQEVYYPFPSRFDIDFEKGNKQLTSKVLNIWKGIVSGNLDAYSKYFKDTLIFSMFDKRIIGTKDSILNIYMERRKNLDVLQAQIDFWHQVYNNEKKEDWVLVWISHVGTKENKMDLFTLHQVWKFNSKNQIYQMQEYKSRWNW